MSRYFCPFCSSSHQFLKTRSDGVFVCGQCGEPLMKKPLIKSRQIFGFISLSVFLAPLLIMILFIVQDFTKEKLPKESNSLVVLNFS